MGNYFLLLTLIYAPAADSVVCMLGGKANSYNAYSDQRPSPDAMQLAGPVNLALAAFCRPNCPQIALFRNPTAANAMLIASGRKSKIVYKPEFFTTVYDAYGEAAIQAILAHELGHAIDATTAVAWIKRDWGPELRADAWTGCALAKLDLSSPSIKAALEVLSKYPPASAPDWTARLQALRAGYTQCGGDAKKIPVFTGEF